MEPPVDLSITSQIISQPREPPMREATSGEQNGGVTNPAAISEQAIAFEASRQLNEAGSSSVLGGHVQARTPWLQRHSQQPLLHDNGQRGLGSQPLDANTSRPINSHENISAFSLPLEQAESNLDTVPVEGQESMMWYDQLFASSFSAIDNPLLVAAEFDASVDPTWNYLR